MDHVHFCSAYYPQVKRCAHSLIRTGLGGIAWRWRHAAQAATDTHAILGVLNCSSSLLFHAPSDCSLSPAPGEAMRHAILRAGLGGPPSHGSGRHQVPGSLFVYLPLGCFYPMRHASCIMRHAPCVLRRSTLCVIEAPVGLSVALASPLWGANPLKPLSEKKKSSSPWSPLDPPHHRLVTWNGGAGNTTAGYVHRGRVPALRTRAAPHLIRRLPLLHLHGVPLGVPLPLLVRWTPTAPQLSLIPTGTGSAVRGFYYARTTVRSPRKLNHGLTLLTTSNSLDILTPRLTVCSRDGVLN